MPFLAHCIWLSIQNKSHIFWKHQAHFLGDIKILKYVIRRKLEIERCDIVCWVWGSIGKFINKNTALGVLRWKNPTFFPHEAFCLSVAAGMFLEVALFLETYYVLKNSWLHAWSTTTVGWQRKSLGFGPVSAFTLSMNSYFQISLL